MRQKLQGVQCLRAFAALLVVFYHLQLFEQKLPGPLVAPPQALYGMSGVDLFFVISGFIVTTISLRQFGKPGQSLRFLRLRFTRIYPIYWVYFLAILAVFLARPDLVNANHGRPNLLYSFLLLPQQATPLLFVSWTLVYELFFYLVFALALQWLRPTQFPFGLLFWAVVVIAGNQLVDTDQPVPGLLFSPLILEFQIGCATALLADRIGRRASLVCLAAGAAGFTLGSAILEVFDIPFSGWQRTIVYGPSAALLVAGVVALERGGLAVPQPLVMLGDASYSLYLSHIIVLGVVMHVWLWLHASPTPLSHVTELLVALTAAVVWALISFRCIEMPILNAMRGRRGEQLPPAPVIATS